METIAKIVLFITFTGLLVTPASAEAKTIKRGKYTFKVRVESFIPDNANGGASNR